LEKTKRIFATRVPERRGGTPEKNIVVGTENRVWAPTLFTIERLDVLDKFSGY